VNTSANAEIEKTAEKTMGNTLTLIL